MPERPSLAEAIRFSIRALVESIHAFLAWNLLLVLASATVIFVLSLTNLAVVLIPLLSPLVCGLLRMAVVARRDEDVALRTAVPGIRHRIVAKLGLAAGQCLLVLVATVNLAVAPAIGGLLGSLSMATSLYLLGAIGAYAFVGWTLLCDPRHDTERLGRLAKLAAVVLIRRPLAMLFIMAMAILSAFLVYSLVVPSLFLPSLLLLLAAGYVVPAADEVSEGGPT